MKTILIVGASSDIGKALADQLYSKGERVIAISRQQPASSFSEFIEYDVLSQDPFPVIDGVIDGLVYCPGSILLKPFKGLKLPDLKQDMELNVYSAVRAIQAYLPNLQLSNAASVVMFSTVAVQVGMPFHAAVSMSKGAIEGLTRALAAELSPKIRVNCVAPSLSQTKMAEKLLNSPEKIELSGQRHPLKRVGTSADIAQAAEFLLSFTSSWITGQIIHVDGGMSSLKV